MPLDAQMAKLILLRHLLEGSCEIAVRMRTSVQYVGRNSRLRLRQPMKNRGFVICTGLSQSAQMAKLIYTCPLLIVVYIR